MAAPVPPGQTSGAQASRFMAESQKLKKSAQKKKADQPLIEFSSKKGEEGLRGEEKGSEKGRDEGEEGLRGEEKGKDKGDGKGDGTGEEKVRPPSGKTEEDAKD